VEEVEWVSVMPKQRTAEEVGVNYSIGDLVSVKYCRVVKDTLKFFWLTGIITDYGGDEGTPLQRSYKVLTVDGRHDWSPRSDLMIIQPIKA
tara:strand:+ start:709 stop:981 length:273 start_codon:yes stop_codon:yes gene_type:complete